MLNIDTKPLLRPTALEDAKSERASLEKKLHNPHIQDKGAVMKQIRNLDVTLASQTPKEFVGAERDAAVKLEQELRNDWTQGMCSQAEMRQNPPGAVDKHLAWQRRTKQTIEKWKNLMLRLNVGNPDNSVANIERYRPKASSLNLDGAQIQSKDYYLPPYGAALPVAFTEAQLAALAVIAPDLRERLATLSNEQRAEVKQALELAEDEK